MRHGSLAPLVSIGRGGAEAEDEDAAEGANEYACKEYEIGHGVTSRGLSHMLPMTSTS